jgi:hypothetical protein
MWSKILLISSGDSCVALLPLRIYKLRLSPKSQDSSPLCLIPTLVSLAQHFAPLLLWKVGSVFCLSSARQRWVVLSVYDNQFCWWGLQSTYPLCSRVEDLLHSPGQVADTLWWNWIRFCGMQVGYVCIVGVQDILESRPIWSVILCYFQTRKRKQEERLNKSGVGDQLSPGQTSICAFPSSHQDFPHFYIKIKDLYVYPMCWWSFSSLKNQNYLILTTITLKYFADILELRASASLSYLPSWTLQDNS